MRLLILTPSLGGKDGVSSLTRRVALALSELGGDVGVWSLADQPDTDCFEVFGPRVTSITVRGASGNKARMVMWSLASLLLDCRELTLVVTHAHLAPLSLPFRARGARTYHVLHGIEVWKPLTFLQARAFRVAERLVCVSAHTELRFEEANPGFHQTVVCHSGLPESGCEGEVDDEGFALIVGRMASSERYKGHDVLLDVWHDVMREVPRATLLVVGDGDDRVRLMDKSQSLGLDEAVRFTGALSDEELDRLYRRCAFFVMPSVHEGFGLVFLEAMRVSKACIGGIGAASEIIVDGETGFVVDPSDSASVTRSIVELFRQPEKRARMGARGREWFDRHFTSAHFRERLRAAVDIDTRG